MALKLDKTDAKGVKTRYHVIRSFACWDGTIVVKLFSYVNQATRDSEKDALEQNALADQYEAKINALRAELEPLIGLEDEESIARNIEITGQINDLAMNADRPKYADTTDFHYDEDEVVIPYFEPLTIEAIYEKLTSDGRYAGAEKI